MKFLKSFLNKIESVQEAEEFLNFSSKILFCIGILQGILFAFLLGSLSTFYFDPLLMFVFGLVIRFSRSRTASVLLFVYSSIIFIATGLSLLEIIGGVGNNPILALALFLVSIRILYASFKFHFLMKSIFVWKNIWIRNLISIVFAFVTSVILFIFFVFLSRSIGIIQLNNVQGEILLFSFPILYILLLLPFFPWAKKRPMYLPSEKGDLVGT
ncbi:hypothetical protein [Leptospira sarikeiensis]|uniref:Uncharacterized protein n=1 Tax=Leptospira sarikeiensis TaxID=2484943 RepID=A0A4R9KBV6_9LEPT|nr:hypothetical protein [Leptospira sarikeiensis]TGL64237.1 hypothetical protein EHQ64_02575 [Leptospira sarikeiensis]